MRSSFEITNCDLKERPWRPPLSSLRLYRTGSRDAFQRAAQRACRRDEYDVRGRRWIDCIVRLGSGRAIGRKRVNNFRLSSPQLRSSSLSLRRLGKASDFIRKILPSRSRIRISGGFLRLASLASRTNDANESALSFQPEPHQRYSNDNDQNRAKNEYRFDFPKQGLGELVNLRGSHG